jgi:hypothetical protein
MAFISPVVILGGRIPLLEDLTSSMAELSGALPSVLTATWANMVLLNSRKPIIKKVNFFMIVRF